MRKNIIQMTKKGVVYAATAATIMSSTLFSGVTFAKEGSGQPVAVETQVTATSGDAARSSVSYSGLVKEGSYYYLYDEYGKMDLDGWVELDGVEYYLQESKKYAVIRIYDPSAGTCSDYNAKTEKFDQRKNALVRLVDNRYYRFDGNGKLEKQSGWYTVNGSKMAYRGADGGINAFAEKSGARWVYKEFNNAVFNGDYKIVTSRWRQIKENYYFFNSAGENTRIYYPSGRKCYDYSAGRWVRRKNSICTLYNNKYYYFDASGTRVTTAGWKQLSAKEYVYVCSSSHVTSRMAKSGSVWSFTSWNNGKWGKGSSGWKTISGNIFNINSDGKSTVAYYGSSRTCYTGDGTSMKQVKNDTVEIMSRVYYFMSNGVRGNKAGWYTTNDGRRIYCDASGVVTKTETGIKIDLGNGRSTTVNGHYDYEMAYELVDMLNAYRRQNGLSALSIDEDLMACADVRSAEISYSFSHTRPNGEICLTASSKMGGENIAAGYRGADAVMEGWKNSPGHNSNMLDSDWEIIGISVFIRDDDPNYYTYYYVQNFG